MRAETLANANLEDYVHIFLAAKEVVVKKVIGRQKKKTPQKGLETYAMLSKFALARV